MNHFYPLHELDGELLYGIRIFFGVAMIISIFAGINAIRKRNYKQHGAWMMRAYAIAMAAGTQVFTHIPVFIFPDLLNESTRALSMGAGWVINLIIAELIIRKRKHQQRQARPTTPSGPATTPSY